MSIIALAIKTIPDIETGRRLHRIDNLSDTGVAKAMFHLQQQHTGSENLPLYLQKIVSIAIASKVEGKIQLTHVGDHDVTNEPISEKILLQAYITQLQHHPQLVTWQGTCYEFPILRYRALKQALTLPHATLLDLSQTLEPATQTCHLPSLTEIALLLDLPSIMPLNMEQTWQTWLAGDYNTIKQATMAEAKTVYCIQQNLAQNKPSKG
jgi:hypothetical protein